MKFGDVLRELLDEDGIKQKKLAEDLNIASSTVGNYIRNAREPDFETLKLFASYFSVSVDYLLDYHAGITDNHAEDELLRIYRSLKKDQKELFLEHGKVFHRYNLKRLQNGCKTTDPNATVHTPT